MQKLDRNFATSLKYMCASSCGTHVITIYVCLHTHESSYDDINQCGTQWSIKHTFSHILIAAAITDFVPKLWSSVLSRSMCVYASVCSVDCNCNLQFCNFDRYRIAFRNERRQYMCARSLSRSKAHMCVSHILALCANMCETHMCALAHIYCRRSLRNAMRQRPKLLNCDLRCCRAKYRLRDWGKVPR